MTADESTTLAVAVGKIEQKLDDQGSKIDAIHRSLKDDIAEVKEQTTLTNGRVRDHDLRLATLKGAFIAFGAASPFLVAIFAYALTKFLG